MIRSKTIVVLESNEALLSEWKKALAGHEGWDLAYMGKTVKKACGRFVF